MQLKLLKTTILILISISFIISLQVTNKQDDILKNNLEYIKTIKSESYQSHDRINSKLPNIILFSINYLTGGNRNLKLNGLGNFFAIQSTELNISDKDRLEVGGKELLEAIYCVFKELLQFYYNVEDILTVCNYKLNEIGMNNLNDFIMIINFQPFYQQQYFKYEHIINIRKLFENIDFYILFLYA